MSLSNETNKKSYSPNVGTTVFDDWDISYFNDNDVIVTIESALGVVTEYVDGSNFDVAATNGDPTNGATITLNGTLSGGTIAGDVVVISRQVPFTQEYDLQDGSSIDPTALNKGLDRTVAQSQQLLDDGTRHLTHPITDPLITTYEAPSVVDRASKVAGWDTEGNVIAVDVGGGGGLIGVDTSKGLAVSGGIVEAKVDDSTVGFSSGDIFVKGGGISPTQLATNAVTSDKILADNVTTVKILDANVTLPKIDFFVDEDTMVSDSAVKVPSQQSVKAYVDTEVAAGGLVQVVNVQDGAIQYFPAATPIPRDNTIPQITEGSEVMTLIVTPTSATNKLKIDVVSHFANNGADLVAALFKDSDADSIACSSSEHAGNDTDNHFFSHYMTSGGTGAITFRLRVGGNGGTTTFNGDNNNAALYGGSLASSITITEIQA